jgi:hypothetical protein
MVEEDISSCRPPGVLISCEVGVSVVFHRRLIATFEVEAVVRCSRKISKDSFYGIPMPVAWVLAEL